MWVSEWVNDWLTEFSDWVSVRACVLYFFAWRTIVHWQTDRSDTSTSIQWHGIVTIKKTIQALHLIIFPPSFIFLPVFLSHWFAFPQSVPPRFQEDCTKCWVVLMPYCCALVLIFTPRWCVRNPLMKGKWTRSWCGSNFTEHIHHPVRRRFETTCDFQVSQLPS